VLCRERTIRWLSAAAVFILAALAIAQNWSVHLIALFGDISFSHRILLAGALP
jgi:hypothetical protein